MRRLLDGLGWWVELAGGTVEVGDAVACMG